MSIFGWATLVFLVVDVAIARYYKARSKRAWVRYEMFSGRANVALFGAWVILAELPLWIDTLFVLYCLTQYIGVWYLSGGERRMQDRIDRMEGR